MKNRPDLVPKKIMVTRKGKTFPMLVWVKPEFVPLETRKIPDGILEMDKDALFRILRDFYKGMTVQNVHTKCKIKIGTKGLNHTAFVRHRLDVREHFFYLDQLLQLGHRVSRKPDEKNKVQIMSTNIGASIL